MQAPGFNLVRVAANIFSLAHHVGQHLRIILDFSLYAADFKTFEHLSPPCRANCGPQGRPAQIMRREPRGFPFCHKAAKRALRAVERESLTQKGAPESLAFCTFAYELSFPHRDKNGVFDAEKRIG